MKISIPVPENYSIPEDVEDGGVFEELVTFRLEGTSLVPTMLAGVEIPMEDAEEDEAVEEMEEEEAPAGPVRPRRHLRDLGHVGDRLGTLVDRSGEHGRSGALRDPAGGGAHLLPRRPDSLDPEPGGRARRQGLAPGR